jgi:signal transduction histidine kinase
MRPHPAILASIGLAASFTIAVSAVPALRFAYLSSTAHIGLETTAALVSLLTAYLVAGRFRHAGQVRDLLIACSLGTCSITIVLFGLRATSSDSAPDAYASWATLLGTLFSACLLLAAAFAPAWTVKDRRQVGVLAALLSLLGLALIGTTLTFVSADLPVGIDPKLSPSISQWPQRVDSPAILGAQLLLAVVLLACAVGFAFRARGDELMQWFAAGAAMGAIARVNYFLFPSLYSNWLYTGDILRLGFYVLLFIGAMREIGSYQRRLAQTAVTEERRRFARDLHDGVAQELAFIESQAHLLRSREDASTRERIISAATRAREESRRAINALTATHAEPFTDVLARAAREVADQLDATVELSLEPGVEAPPAARTALARIMCEAIRNAARHGRADRIVVALANSDGISLRIDDNGRGFDLGDSAAHTGLGLVAMRERIEALGGSLQLESSPRHGTHVEATLP